MIYKHFLKVHINIFFIFSLNTLVKLKVISHEHVCDRNEENEVSKQNQSELEMGGRYFLHVFSFCKKNSKNFNIIPVTYEMLFFFLLSIIDLIITLNHV